MRLPLWLLPEPDGQRLSRALAQGEYQDVWAGAESLIPERRVPRLTRREIAVLQALALGGAPLAEIAALLHVSLNTVKSQLRTVYRKLEVDNRRDALAVAVHLGFLDHCARRTPRGM